MNANIRLALIVVFFVVVAALLWHLLRTEQAGENSESRPPGEKRPVQTSADESADRHGGSSTIAERLEESGPRGDYIKPQRRSRRIERGEGVIRGTVTTAETGEPVGGASITMARFEDRGYPMPVEDAKELTTETDAQGRYAIEELPWAEYGIRAAKGGLYAVRSGRVSPDRPLKTVDLKMQPADEIAGRVVDGAGESVPQVKLFPYQRQGEDKAFIAEWATAMVERTDEAGHFRFAHLWMGGWRILAKAEGYATLITEYIPVGTTDAELVMGHGGGVRGVVVEQGSGEPVGGVKVVVVSDLEHDRRAAETDTSGAFAITSLRPADYTLTVDDAHLAAVGGAVTFRVVEGQQTSGVRVEVAGAAAITGRVYDLHTQEGIGGVVIAAQPDGHPAQRRDSEPSAASGEYIIEGLAEGRYEVARQPKAGMLDPQPGEGQFVSVALGSVLDGVDFGVSLGVGATGRVIDEDGRGIAGALVIARTGYRGRRSEATSGREGRFAVTGFTEGDQAYLRATKGTLTSAPAGPFALNAEGVSDIEIVVTAEGAISGSVVDTAGRPVKEAVVFPRPASSKSFLGLVQVEVDASGAFEIAGLYGGAFSLAARAPGYAARSVDVALEAGEHLTGIEIVLEGSEGLSISGRVSDAEGKGIRDASVSAGAEESQGRATTDASGSYRIAGLAAGPHQVIARHGDFGEQNRDNVRAGATGVDFVLVKRGIIEGRVVDARSKRPVSVFEIGAVRVGPALLPSADIEATSRGWVQPQLVRVHDEEGRFRLAGQEAGAILIEVHAEGYAPGMHQVTNLRDGEIIANVAIALEPGRVVEGTVTDASRKPVPGAMIFIGDLPPENLRRRSQADASTDAAGAFRVSTLAALDDRLTVYHPAYTPATVALHTNLNQERVTVVLSLGGAVEGTVRLGGEPLSGAIVRIEQSAASPQAHSANPRTDANGFYRLAG